MLITHCTCGVGDSVIIVGLSEVLGGSLLYQFILLGLLAEVLGRSSVLPCLLAQLSNGLSLILELILQLG